MTYNVFGGTLNLAQLRSLPRATHGQRNGKMRNADAESLYVQHV